jgi:hypothetical protein
VKYGRIELAKFFGMSGFEDLVQVLEICLNRSLRFFLVILS